MIEYSEEKARRLQHAIIHLSAASSIIGECASGVKPFKASKFLNVLMKEVYQCEHELRTFLKGELPDSSQLWNEKQSSVLIMKALAKDGELDSLHSKEKEVENGE